MQTLPTDLPIVFSAVAGLVIGNWLAEWIVRLTEEQPVAGGLACPRCGLQCSRMRRIPLAGWFLRGRCRGCGGPVARWMLAVEIGNGILFAAFAWLLLVAWCHDIEPHGENEPSESLARLVHYLVLIALLVAATGTDLRRYVVPDQITLPGALFAMAMSAAFGSQQLTPVWMEWRSPAGLPQLRYAELPEWIAAHPHWHGFAASLAGLIAGAGLVWLVRAISRLLLGREALGFGDVTLMGMIGSFVGWQAAVLIAMLAPLTGIVAATAVRLTSHRTMLPYGPWLCLATLIVIGGWRWIWMFELETGPREKLMLRELFGDPALLGILGGISLVALVLLLGLLRSYKSIPVGRR
ncbi:MAG: A24 family peptidase [Planctomycetales bacterium]